MAVQMESHLALPYTCECGRPLVQIARQTMSSPAEWECPRCDGNLTERELASLDRDPDDDGDQRYDAAKDDGRI